MPQKKKVPAPKKAAPKKKASPKKKTAYIDDNEGLICAGVANAYNNLSQRERNKSF